MISENKTPWTWKDAYQALPTDEDVVLVCYESDHSLRYFTGYYNTGLGTWFDPRDNFIPWPDWWTYIGPLPTLEHFDPS